MKISELVTRLEALWAEHGDVDVQSTAGCGCCEWEEDPAPVISNYPNPPFSSYVLLNY